MGPIVSIIAALSENRVIGRAGVLPWHLPDDLKHFKALTIDRCVIMGRRTFESFGRPLPGRVSIVVTRRSGYKHDGVLVAHDLAEALTLARDAKGDEEIFIGGGEEIYRLALPLSDRMYLTIIHARLDGDTRFPDFDEHEWRVVEDERHEADERHAYAFSFRTHERTKAETPKRRNAER